VRWEDAVAVAARAHGTRRDKVGTFELAHAIEVASALGDAATDDELAAAVLHDVLEDTEWTAERLRDAGVPEVVVAAVEHVSRREEPEKERYWDFVERTATARGEAGAIARRVKLADLTVNSRRPGPDARALREKRYLPAMDRIRGAMRAFGESEPRLDA
jgi:(p)ppGpp synthase/HD superfamily hydrolase